MSEIQLSRKAFAAIGAFLKDKLKEDVDLFDTSNALAEIIEKEVAITVPSGVSKKADEEVPAVVIKPMTEQEKEEDKKKNKQGVVERPGGPPKANRNIGGIRDENGKPVSPPFGTSS